MESRSKILGELPDNKFQPIPEIDYLYVDFPDVVSRFCETLISIGGAVISVGTISGANEYLRHQYPESKILSAVNNLGPRIESLGSPHEFENVEVIVLSGLFGVAENGAVWVTDQQSPVLALPYICQHLVVTLRATDILSDMHRAYEKIGSDAYAFGCFIAGPSKTADIEQSLVLGAHGPKTMTVLLISE